MHELHDALPPLIALTPAGSSRTTCWWRSPQTGAWRSSLRWPYGGTPSSPTRSTSQVGGAGAAASSSSHQRAALWPVATVVLVPSRGASDKAGAVFAGLLMAAAGRAIVATWQQRTNSSSTGIGLCMVHRGAGLSREANVPRAAARPAGPEGAVLHCAPDYFQTLQRPHPYRHANSLNRPLWMT
jgi:hypothetical protein